MKILCLAPHSDDEILGCGGVLAKYAKQGHDVYSCIVTMAYTPDWTERQIVERYEEIEEVSRIIGLKDVIHLRLPTVKLDTIPQKNLNDTLATVINQIKPDIMFIPHRGDINRDHQLVFESAMVAVRPFGDVPSRVLSYEVLSSTEWYANQHAFNPNVFIEISDTLDIKLKAMRAYKHGIKEPPHPRSLLGIESLATLRGLTIGVKAAEAFMLVREIVRD